MTSPFSRVQSITLDLENGLAVRKISIILTERYSTLLLTMFHLELSPSPLLFVNIYSPDGKVQGNTAVVYFFKIYDCTSYIEVYIILLFEKKIIYIFNSLVIPLET